MAKKIFLLYLLAICVIFTLIMPTISVEPGILNETQINLQTVSNNLSAGTVANQINSIATHPLSLNSSDVSILSGNTKEKVRIGVLANRGRNISIDEWGPTADYLTEHLSPVSFEIVPLDFNETSRAAANHEVSFIIVNPSVYTELEYKGLALKIATLQVPGDPDPQPVFGGVIFTRSDRNEINSISDLRGKRFFAVEKNSLGGWQAALLEITQAGIDSVRDFSSLNFSGTHDATVYAVLNGDADAGTVRSTQLERMEKEGTVNLSQIKVLNNQESAYPHYPYLISTHLYPEWPFAAVAGTDNELSKRVAIALLMMDERDPAAKAARGAGWAIPQDHTTVHDLLLGLNLPPYENVRNETISQPLNEYLSTFIAIMCGIVLISVFIIYFWKIKN